MQNSRFHAPRRIAFAMTAAAALALALGSSGNALARASAAPPHLSAQFHAAYADHPVVREVATGQVLGLLARERALTEALPADRALAIIDAVGVVTAKRLFVGDGIARALRARHSVGPSGAMLGKAIDVNLLSAREALVLGWARALEASDSAKTLSRKGDAIVDAGAHQLLSLAVAKAPGVQAPKLALALLNASLAPRSGKRACEAWTAVQRAARDGGSESVRLAAAESAIAAVTALGRACKPKDQRLFAAAVSLPPPAAEPAAAQTRIGPGPRPNVNGSKSGAQRFGVAWTVLAPFFKGYLSDGMVGRIARGERLNEATMAEQLKRDPTGDLSIAALNASILMRRLAYDDHIAVAWLAILRNHGLVDTTDAIAQALPLTALTATEAMMWAYTKAIAGENSDAAAPDMAAPVTAYNATPRQLFVHGRKLAPGNALLGPVAALAHEVDASRHISACNARERAENTKFIINRGQLPPAAKQALSEAMLAVVASCTATPTAGLH